MSFVLISHCSSTSLAGKVSYEANGPDSISGSGSKTVRMKRICWSSTGSVA